jgi:hypothetical protein
MSANIVGTFDIGEFLRKQEKLRQEANDANQARSDKIQGIQDNREQMNQEGLAAAEGTMQGRVGSVQSLLQGLGTSAKRRARDDNARRGAEDQQSLINRGLFNTTVTDQVNRGRRRELDDQLGRIDESVRTAQSGATERTTGDLGRFQFDKSQALQGLLGDRQGFLERESDVGPDQNSIFNLLGMLGQGGGAAGAYGGGGFRGRRGPGVQYATSRGFF